MTRAGGRDPDEHGNFQAGGRPLGLLVLWLTQHCLDKPAHVDKKLLKRLASGEFKEQRRALRRKLIEFCPEEAAHLLFCERHQTLDEDSEPDTAP